MVMSLGFTPNDCVKKMNNLVKSKNLTNNLQELGNGERQYVS